MAVLQELLNLGLVDIGSDDTRFEKMQTASSALAERFGKEARLLIPATLIALDDDVDENDPFFSLVEEMVVAEWQTLRNTHTNRPRQLLRSVAIDALATKSRESAEVSGIIWNTAVSSMRHQKLRLGKAADLIENILDQAFERAETEAIERAGMIDPKPRRRVKKKTSDRVEFNFKAEVNDEEIFDYVARAAGPQNPPGTALQNANPYWSNQQQHWSIEFAPRMTAAVTKAVNLGTSRLGKSIANDFATYVEERLQGQIKAFEQMQAEVERTSASERMRLDVLWWSEARYSPLFKKGYREFSPYVGALVAAVDLTAIVPPLAPASVSYVLGETISKIYVGREERSLIQSVEGCLNLLADASLELVDELPKPISEEGRIPLFDITTQAVSGHAISKDNIRLRTGVDPDLQLSPAEFAMWMFNEFQARRMVGEIS